MIYTVTFNPALDISGVVRKLVPNEKCYVHEEITTPGGNGINAGIVASRLNADVTLTGFLGGTNGETIASLLKKDSLKRRFVSIVGNSRMNVTVSQENSHQQTRLSFPGPRVHKVEWDGLLKVLEKAREGKDIIVLGGSLPPGISAAMVGKLVHTLRERNLFCMVDMPALILEKLIVKKPSFIKPNLQEFQELTKSKASGIKDVLNKMKSLHAKVSMICVSSVEGGALLSNGNEVWFGKTPKLAVKSTVGAGDSMVGAMAALLTEDRNTPVERLLRYGLAAASASLSERGLTLGSHKSMENFLPKIFLRPIRTSGPIKWE